MRIKSLVLGFLAMLQASLASAGTEHMLQLPNEFTFTQAVEKSASGALRFCAEIANKSTKPILLPSPFSFHSGSQLSLLFFDSVGNPIPHRGIRQLAPPTSPAPYPTDRLNYDRIWPGDTLITCKLVRQDELPKTDFSSVVEFKPWLSDQGELPLNDTEKSIYVLDLISEGARRSNQLRYRAKEQDFVD